jgi:hypothetical protein
MNTPNPNYPMLDRAVRGKNSRKENKEVNGRIDFDLVEKS